MLLLLVTLACSMSFTYAEDARCYSEERREPLEALNVQIETIARITAMVNSESDGGPEFSTYLTLMVDGIKKIYEICPHFKTEVVELSIAHRITPEGTDWVEEPKTDMSLALINYVKNANSLKGSFAYELLDSVK